MRTTITLRALKPDAMRSTKEKIVDTVAEAFYGIDPADFAVVMNEVSVIAKPVEYDFVYPENAASTGQLVDDVVYVPDIGTIPIKYAVRFRMPGQHLTAAKRGARIYCNKRLAAGPSLFKLGTGMHNFHAQDYLECVVIADALDQLGVDFVNTNRTQLREDNDIVDTVLQHVSDLMKAAMAAHSKYRDKKVETEIGESEHGKLMKKIISHLPARSRTPAGKLLKTIAARYGTDSIEFKEMAPLVVQSVNASETLIRLIELQSDAQTLGQVASELRELAEIERSDSLKLYRGRKNGIIALRNLIEKGEDLWKTKRIENELQELFKKDPWLIKPEYSHYLTSDQNLQRLASKIAKMLGVDTFAPIVDETGKPDKDRPDLTFVMSDAASPHVFTIVELKSPSIPLHHDHLVQLQTYMAKVELFISTELKKPATVNGYLIGAMPDETERLKDGEMLLMSQIGKRPPSSQWEVIGLEQVLARAQEIHSDAIKAFEVDEVEILETEVLGDAATNTAKA